ncbi:Putative penicillin-binding protein PbpX [Corynebacterium kalinowskii]|uniref:Penicillin-binding protein PbpX n=1 Tax=Corynebacterium kalinowskii TaxID=2675216 RepID=A0A6B8VAZ2_9CORY|nr:serine hydrolase domain-containing protein [Corynebacterium kalinowskii]QGU01423.1 Putative penicillin-binding protein PbpX [Corynebacterium kalinowskii]
MLARIFALLLAVVLFPIPLAGAQEGTNIQRYVDQMVASGVPGAAIVVTQGDRILATGSGGELDTNSRVPIASLTKAFTATAVMKLVEDGRVDLDERAAKYLPEFQLDDPRGEFITVRQLLNQSSGITDATLGFNQYQVGNVRTEDAVRQLSRTRLAYDPGSSWDYCNANYWVLQQLIETISGEPLAEFLAQNVLEPLGMTDTGFANTPATLPELAPTYSYAFGRPISLAQPELFYGGAGGMVSTLDDLGIWLRFQHGFIPGVLTSDSLAELHRRQSPLHQYKVGYALGWWSGEPADGGIPRVSHSGSGPGVSTYAGLFPDNIAIGALIDATGPQADRVAADIHGLLVGNDPTNVQLAPPAWPDVCAVLFSFVFALAVLRSAGTPLSASRLRFWLLTMSLTAITTGCFLAPQTVALLMKRQASWGMLWHYSPVFTLVLLSIGTLALLSVASRLIRRFSTTV